MRVDFYVFVNVCIPREKIKKVPPPDFCECIVSCTTLGSLTCARCSKYISPRQWNTIMYISDRTAQNFHQQRRIFYVTVEDQETFDVLSELTDPSNHIWIIHIKSHEEPKSCCPEG